MGLGAWSWGDRSGYWGYNKGYGKEDNLTVSAVDWREGRQASFFCALLFGLSARQQAACL